jgi:hypothetical protein
MIERRLERWAPAVAQRQHRPPLGRELQDLVLVPVAEVHMVVRADEDPVSIAQALASPPGDEVAVGVEDQNRRVLPLVEVHAVLGVHRHVADQSEAPPHRQGAPGPHHVVDELTGAYHQPGRLIA